MMRLKILWIQAKIRMRDRNYQYSDEEIDQAYTWGNALVIEM
jgi:hypothetical protein